MPRSWGSHFSKRSYAIRNFDLSLLTLFSHKALAKVFQGKLLAAIDQEGLALPTHLPQKWVVDCKCVGSGQKALVYLGRCLYRGVIQEKDILRCADGQVRFRYRDAKTGKMEVRTLSGAAFL